MIQRWKISKIWRVCGVSTFLPVVPCLGVLAGNVSLINLVLKLAIPDQKHGVTTYEPELRLVCGNPVRRIVRRDVLTHLPLVRNHMILENVCERSRDRRPLHSYLESVLRLCLLFLEGFRGNELGMMGVGVQGRLLRARRMQGGLWRKRWEKERETKRMTWHGTQGGQLTLKELIIHAHAEIGHNQAK